MAAARAWPAISAALPAASFSHVVTGVAAAAIAAELGPSQAFAASSVIIDV